MFLFSFQKQKQNASEHMSVTFAMQQTSQKDVVVFFSLPGLQTTSFCLKEVHALLIQRTPP